MDESTSGSFQYANPGVIHWGQGCVAERLESELLRVGASRVFVVATASMERNPALLAAVERQLGGRLAGR
ncbi:MAG: hypothetical protein NVS4B10_03520 [Myxococcales bacterium]